MQWLRTLRQDYPRLSRWVLGGGTFPSTVVGGRDGLCSRWRKKQGGGHQPRICTSLEDVLERMRKWVLNKRTLGSIQFYQCLHSGTMTARSEPSTVRSSAWQCFQSLNLWGFVAAAVKSQIHIVQYRRDVGWREKVPSWGEMHVAVASDAGILVYFLMYCLIVCDISSCPLTCQDLNMPKSSQHTNELLKHQPNGLLCSQTLGDTIFFTRKNIAHVIF